MSLDWDLINILALFALAAGVGIAYLIRILFKGRPEYARVDKQGGSSLLNVEVMKAAYWFFQPLGRFLIICGLTPNMISWFSLLFGFLAGLCLCFGHFGFGAAFSAVSAILDALDGLVARETGRSSDAGEVLDATVDRFNEFFFLGGLLFYYREIPSMLLLTMAAMIGSFMVSYSSAKAEALQVDPPKGNMRRPERALYLTLGAALSPITIPWLERLRDTPIVLGHPMIVALVLVAVLANISAIERMWAIAKLVRAREVEQARAKARGVGIASSSATAHLAESEDLEPAEQPHNTK